MFKKLQIEDRLQIFNKPEQEYYTANIIAVDENEILISEPLSGGKQLNMPQYSNWQFYLNKDDGVYYFTSLVVGVKGDGILKSYQIKHPGTAHRHQRRGHVRVPCHHNLLYWHWNQLRPIKNFDPKKIVYSPDLWSDAVWVKDYLGAMEETCPSKPAFSLDMSGGGLRLVSLDPMLRQDRLLMKIYLDEKNKEQLLLLEGKVVRVSALNIGGWKRYRAGISFLNLDQKIQEQIISYLFTIMRQKVEKEV